MATLPDSDLYDTIMHGMDGILDDYEATYLSKDLFEVSMDASLDISLNHKANSDISPFSGSSRTNWTIPLPVRDKNRKIQHTCVKDKIEAGGYSFPLSSTGIPPK